MNQGSRLRYSINNIGKKGNIIFIGRWRHTTDNIEIGLNFIENVEWLISIFKFIIWRSQFVSPDLLLEFPICHLKSVWKFINFHIFCYKTLLPSRDNSAFRRSCEHWTRLSLCSPGWWAPPAPAWRLGWPRTRPRPAPWRPPTGWGCPRTSPDLSAPQRSSSWWSQSLESQPGPPVWTQRYWGISS